jgi:hypothetical protein
LANKGANKVLDFVENSVRKKASNPRVNQWCN